MQIGAVIPDPCAHLCAQGDSKRELLSALVYSGVL